MARRPSLVILLIALSAAVTAACGSASTGASATAPRTTSDATAAAAPVATQGPVATTSARTVTVTATNSATASPTRSQSTPAPTSSAASFTAFAGEWVGHTRFAAVSKTGRLEEHVGDGCCDPIIDLVLQLSNPHRAGGTWVASTRVVSATPHAGWKQTGRPAPKPGDRGTVTVGADHILVESITDNGFCDQDKTAPGTCGA